MSTPAPFRLEQYDESRQAEWDALIGSSTNGTMLHTRRFLSYHGDRYADCSLLVVDHRDQIIGVFPAATDPAAADTVTSHPGVTYGGLVHDGSIRGDATITVLNLLASHLQCLGFTTLRYKAVPYIYHSVPSADDVYALFRLGATRYRCDLSAAIEMGDETRRVGHGRRDGRRRAAQADVVVHEGWEPITEFWGLLEETLTERHQARPVHSLEEINVLHDRFPRGIVLLTATVSSELVGGVMLFLSGPSLHLQYSATSASGRAKGAIDPLLEAGIELARSLNCRYFDFGTSNTNEGQALNPGLYRFKTSFGAGGVVHEHYELPLR